LKNKQLRVKLRKFRQFPYLQLMKFTLLLYLIFIFSGASAQKIIRTEKVTDHSTHILGNDFEGIVFHDNYFQNPKDSVERKIKRFTPTTADIEATEQILHLQRKNKANKGDKDYIFRHLGGYRRQYIGYIDSTGDTMVYVNCFPKDEDWATEKAKRGNKTLDVPRWYDSLFWVFDGGKSFWQAYISLRTKKIKSMSVNGLA